MSNFWVRAITGTLFVILLVGGIVWRPESLAALFGLTTILGLWEFYGLLEKGGHAPQKLLGMLGGISLYAGLVGSLWSPDLGAVLNIAGLSVLLLFVFELFRQKEQPFSNIALTLTGLIYVALPFALLNFLATETPEHGYLYDLVMAFFIFVWTNDTGAYLSGRAFGKHKLFERISPKKTWEGSIGGAVLTVGAAIILSKWQFNEGIASFINTWDWIIIGLLVVIFGSLGDLVESMLKRSLGVKDSGNILPGHGGILDRFDGVLLAAPAVYLYMRNFIEFG